MYAWIIVVLGIFVAIFFIWVLRITLGEQVVHYVAFLLPLVAGTIIMAIKTEIFWNNHPWCLENALDFTDKLGSGLALLALALAVYVIPQNDASRTLTGRATISVTLIEE